MPNSPQDPRSIDVHRHGPVDRSRILALRCVTLADLAGDDLPDDGPLSIGLHPWDIQRDTWESDLLAIESYARSDHRIAAIGEAGLDRVRGPELPLQMVVFTAQAQLAARLSRPLVVHCVRCASDLLRIRRGIAHASPWILHGWNGSPAHTATLVASTDFVFSFGAGILHPSSKARKSVALVPPDRILVETDASGLEPEQVELEAARLRGVAVQDFRADLQRTWMRLFGPSVTASGSTPSD